MGSLISRNKLQDSSTSNSSLSEMRYVTATVHVKPKWKDLFSGKKKVPVPVTQNGRKPQMIPGCKTSISPGGVMMIYPQKKRPWRKPPPVNYTNPNIQIVPRNMNQTIKYGKGYNSKAVIRCNPSRR